MHHGHLVFVLFGASAIVHHPWPCGTKDNGRACQHKGANLSYCLEKLSNLHGEEDFGNPSHLSQPPRDYACPLRLLFLRISSTSHPTNARNHVLIDGLFALRSYERQSACQRLLLPLTSSPSNLICQLALPVLSAPSTLTSHQILQHLPHGSEEWRAAVEC